MLGDGPEQAFKSSSGESDIDADYCASNQSACAAEHNCNAANNDWSAHSDHHQGGRAGNAEHTSDTEYAGYHSAKRNGSGLSNARNARRPAVQSEHAEYSRGWAMRRCSGNSGAQRIDGKHRFDQFRSVAKLNDTSADTWHRSNGSGQLVTSRFSDTFLGHAMPSGNCAK